LPLTLRPKVELRIGIEKETTIAGSINSIPIPTPTAIPKIQAIAGTKHTNWRRILVRLRDFGAGREDKPGLLSKLPPAAANHRDRCG
jgi:hypothetical protein